MSDVDQTDEISIEELKNKVNELENNWKRAVADYRNLQKRFEEERVQFIEFANEVLIQGLLPIVDNLEMLDQHLNDTGLKLTLKEFKQVLTNVGVKEVETDGKNLDPLLMEAIESIEGENGKVIEVVNKGYTLNGKLVRPARVKVGKGQNKEETL